MSDVCEVCEGTGLYPVINRHGRQLYEITCPHCFGDGRADAMEKKAK